jgi:hypothetical protein
MANPMWLIYVVRPLLGNLRDFISYYMAASVIIYSWLNTVAQITVQCNFRHGCAFHNYP